MLAAAIQYSQKENQLKAVKEERRQGEHRMDPESCGGLTHIMAVDPVLDEEDTEATGAD